MTYIHCPDCDAIREMNTAACPECGQCANCGEKIPEGTQICDCGFPGDEKLVKRIQRRYDIPDESVEQARSEWQRRKKLEPVKLAARILLLGLCIVLGVITAVKLLAESNELTKIVLGVPVFCLLVFLYWVFFQGIARILIWTAKKIGMRD